MRKGRGYEAIRKSKRSLETWRGSLVHHSDRGAHNLSIRHIERHIETGVERSLRIVAESYDNALAETIIGLFKTEVIRRREPMTHHRCGRISQCRVGRSQTTPVENGWTPSLWESELVQ